jgi:hypothetical protein
MAVQAWRNLVINLIVALAWLVPGLPAVRHIQPPR